ncbi:MAG: hypothetical protein KDC00_06735 [Flavobacteriales bacterium]|nr:hypothetical protein [Flavobacteriales bacterium]
MILLWVQAYLLGPELLKLPLLIGHFVEHSMVEEDLSLSRFLEEHYAGLGHEEDCDTEHDGLPYHHHHGAADGSLVPIFMARPVSATSFCQGALTVLTGLPSVADTLPGHTRGLIQPPRG